MMTEYILILNFLKVKVLDICFSYSSIEQFVNQCYKFFRTEPHFKEPGQRPHQFHQALPSQSRVSLQFRKGEKTLFDEQQ